MNRLVLLGAFIRNFGGSVNTYFLPVFFLKNYPQFKSQYSYVNSAILSCAGFVSGIVAGVLADALEKKSYRTKSYICMAGCVLAFPLIAMATLQTSHFWVSMTCFSIMTFFSSSFAGSAITMMQNSSKRSLQGSVVSTYFFNTTLAQTLGPMVFNFLAQRLGAPSDPRIYGKLITLTTLIGYWGSVPIWWLVGKRYEKMMQDRDRRQLNI